MEDGSLTVVAVITVPEKRDEMEDRSLMLNGYSRDCNCTMCAHLNCFHHDVSGRCTISGCTCRRFSPTPIVPENPNSDKHHIAAKVTG